jgi:hypothetical protein
MSEVIEPPKNEVVIKCSMLSGNEARELETFLKSQHGVEDVRFRTYTRDHALDRDTLGWITQVPWELVVVLGNSVKEAVPYLVPLVTLYLIARKDRIQQEKEQRQQEADNTELVPIVDPHGQTVRIVSKPKSKAR